VSDHDDDSGKTVPFVRLPCDVALYLLIGGRMDSPLCTCENAKNSLVRFERAVLIPRLKMNYVVSLTGSFGHCKVFWG